MSQAIQLDLFAEPMSTIQHNQTKFLLANKLGDYMSINPHILVYTGAESQQPGFPSSFSPQLYDITINTKYFPLKDSQLLYKHICCYFQKIRSNSVHGVITQIYIPNVYTSEYLVRKFLAVLEEWFGLVLPRNIIKLKEPAYKYFAKHNKQRGVSW